MSRITKQISQEVAGKLVEVKRKEFEIISKDFKNRVYEEAIKHVPQDVNNAFKNNPNYIRSSQYVQISGKGWNYERILLSKSIPSKNGHVFQLIPELQIAKELLKIFNVLKEKDESIDLLESDLQIAILNLRTYKSVEENFPEAFLLLPKIVNNSVAVNLSDIRNRINA